jgi:hypothetical protein
MQTIPRVDTEHFKTNGYVLVKNVFSKDEMRTMRAGLESAKQRIIDAGQFRTEPSTPNAKFLFGDPLSMPELSPNDYVLLDRRLVESVKQILGPKLVYFGDSSVQAGEGARGFHKDNVDRNDAAAPDWQSDYTLVRFGVYFEDHSRFSGGLKLRRKSQNYATHLKGRMVDIETEVGDLLIWNLRTTHSGNNVRIRGLRNICLHPRIEQKVPHFLRVPEQLERIAMFGTFGAPSSHLERYITWMKGRGDFDRYWRYAGYNRDLVALAQTRGVELRRPVEFYGADYSLADGRSDTTRKADVSGPASSRDAYQGSLNQ